ncbi:MAG: putative monovalent cation/H+ antiporter subunit A [Planctomycetaceae bacterium]
MDAGLFWAVLSGFVLAAVSPWIVRAAGRAQGVVLALLPLALTAFFASRLAAARESGIAAAEGIAWMPGLDFRLSFFADGLSLLFCVLICGIGALVLIYAASYLRGHPDLPRFYVSLLSFMASMLGVVLADNILVLFVFWELTSLTSYFLIGFDHERPAARAAALQALLVTGGGGLALLAGLLMLGHVAGSYELSVIASGEFRLAGHPLALPILLLILLGAFTKSAQFPFHFWLPNAMEAPTPVSAYLHSSTMVKAGIYLLARLSPALSATADATGDAMADAIDWWYWLVTGFGGATAVIGAWLAFRETYLKRILAYSTVSSLGILVMLLGLGTEEAVVAAVVYLLAHALFKATLFLVAGSIDHETGVRDAEQLGGLASAMPFTAAASVVAALSMAGFPPLFGFLGKEQLLEAASHAPVHAVPALVALAVAATLTVAVAILAGVKPFIGRRTPTPRSPHEPPAGMLFGPVSLSAAGVALGLAPWLVGELLVAPAAGAILGKRWDVELHLWHGFTLVLGISLAILAVGTFLYFVRRPAGRLALPIDWIANRGPARWYEGGIAALNAIAAGQTRLLQSGYLRRYLLICISVAAGLAVFTYAERGRAMPSMSAWWREVRIHEGLIVVITFLALIAAVLSRSRLGAIAAMGAVGYGVALIYVLFGAPDLAMTQFVVETLTVILFVLAFHHLPGFARFSSRPAKIRDAVIAIGVGALMTTLVLIANEVQVAKSISWFYAENSLDGGHGRNIVNVILVDFRGIDTLGEITVLAVAGIGVYALLKLRPK